ncbi:MAG: CAAX prenyl protease-related protein [Bryobacter sp.]|nr:CAAX prenyl protease-related protein [Bryobacter sp.]
MNRHLVWIGPFLVFIALLAVQDYLMKALGAAEFPLRIVIVAAAIWYFSRPVLSFRVVNWAGSLGMGVFVFLVWIGPDALIPGWRNHWLFQNSITGQLKTSIDAALLSSPLVLFMRTFRAAVIVPIVEELFWRGWLLRWLIKPEFEQVALGTFQMSAFWISAFLFAAEHGPYWEVGLAAGVLYNWWMIRTKSLGDLILAHGVTNLCLSLYVIATKNWQYWL